ncbi:MAG: proline--tRNA ligase [Zetaproteobacteria bacterium CG06_land_8_20_14_3_00_59_53]|nr:MAG: proline--tRNA ligase [Zetaproteobacteria bacterium CG2_30_59_37]PIO90747.1 MAG: proline--tRNA ligase [Zetaproteobacteria bacterium CG23_combo_of_CG06-09_8_20_14_all_59_86]PIQ65319.1 MAG: proline--tRNA ligase [Zetaproteobacteria bacterium CG11_big_fil_rev_8_21_14_0_20_59_439]PIU69861.1 MAG: proline--tRNA ligase [Zetaproteobacteria bacterium CG06_land_8_20_14_3_00_59_53]PIU97387.1 MAG: proline--tRNA ligase [Zetaproteobacteria bacterium CG03_land_8_20_14_0_80_59_51]PIY45687.1 MAG: proline
MKYSQFFAPTLRDDPADAEVISHKLLLRAGYIRRVTSGVYDFLPLGLLVMRRIEAVVREEMNAAGAQELLMPMVQPSELWQSSGRWEKYGPELLRFTDRHEHESCLGPTHEEVICDLVARELRSYKQMPLNLYQIQAKFRDEIRPRFGLLRGREFIMKDAYSFHATEEDLTREYQNMFATYQRIFTRLGLTFRAVEADTGSIGGNDSHEFHVLADSGEDLIAHCDGCEYAANVEKAVSVRGNPDGEAGALSEVSTPNASSVEDVTAFLKVDAAVLVKTLVYRVTGGELDEQIVAACVRGDDQLQEVKLIHAIDADAVEMADEAGIASVGGIGGFVGPAGISCKVLVDESLRGATGLVAGGNKHDVHVTGMDVARDVPTAIFADLRETRAGDKCGRCGGSMGLSRGIEVGQVFALGKRYTEPMKVRFHSQEGREETATMGCYGIGVSRLMAAIVEQCNDENGIAWPLDMAPFHVALIGMGKGDEVEQACAGLYKDLQAAGFDVLWDERNERPGVKFKDAELLGLPLQLVVGDRGLKEGVVELGARGGDRRAVPLNETVAGIVALAETLRGVGSGHGAGH